MRKRVIEKAYEGVLEVSMAKDRVIFTPRMRGSAFTVGIQLVTYEFEHSNGRALRIEEVLQGGKIPVRKVPRHLYDAGELPGGNVGLYDTNSGRLEKMVSLPEFPIYYEEYHGEVRKVFTSGEGRESNTPRNPWLKEESIVQINVGDEGNLNDKLSRLKVIIGIEAFSEKGKIVTGFVEMHQNFNNEVEYKFNGEQVIVRKWEDRYKTMKGFSKAFYSAMLGNTYLRDGRMKILKMYGNDMDMKFRFEVRFIVGEV